MSTSNPINHGHTAESLIAFTERVKTAFLEKRIASPVHLCSNTQAAPLIDIFKEVRPEDWCFGTWRSSYMCLLKGMPESEVFDAILAGRSMFMSSKEYRIYCSSIVGGILPIALGVAAGIKRERSFCKTCGGAGLVDLNVGDDMPWACTDCHGLNHPPKVWVFVGDMCARTGLYHEFCQYAFGHDLPVRIVIEGNRLSTNADTEKTWGIEPWPQRLPRVKRYSYERTAPHVGCGIKVQF